MFRQKLSLLGLLIIFNSNSGRCECDPLPYREDVKAVCTSPTEGIVDCYYTKFSTGSIVTYDCEDNYIIKTETSPKNKRVLVCDENGFWTKYITFQFFECKLDCDSDPTSFKCKNNDAAEETHSLGPKLNLASPADNISKIRTEVLNAHNTYRSIHHAPLLKLNSELNSEAQSYAELLIKTNIFINQRQPGKKYLKNIYEQREIGIYNPAVDIARTAVNEWYGKVDEYNKDSPKASTFTQIVWRSTTSIGVGLATKITTDANGEEEKRTVVVVAYFPAGNINGKNGAYFKANVLV